MFDISMVEVGDTIITMATSGDESGFIYRILGIDRSCLGVGYINVKAEMSMWKKVDHGVAITDTFIVENETLAENPVHYIAVNVHESLGPSASGQVPNLEQEVKRHMLSS